MIDTPEFDWGSDESVVLQEQPAVAVYENTRGLIVILRRREWDEDELHVLHTSGAQKRGNEFEHVLFRNEDNRVRRRRCLSAAVLSFDCAAGTDNSFPYSPPCGHDTRKGTRRETGPP